MFSPLLVCDTCGKLPSRRDTSAGRDANLANFNVSARTYKSSHKDLKINSNTTKCGKSALELSSPASIEHDNSCSSVHLSKSKFLSVFFFG